MLCQMYNAHEILMECSTTRLGKQSSLLSDLEYQQLEEGSFERNSIELLSKFYVDFAKYGYAFVTTLNKKLYCMVRAVRLISGMSVLFSNPLPDSEPITFVTTAANETQYNYFDITNDGIVIKTNPNYDHMQFWNGIFDQYSVHWQIREFNLNSLAVKVPLMLLASLLLTIGLCKSVKIFYKKHKLTENNHSN